MFPSDVIPLALVDSLNPAGIAIAVCLTVVDRPAPALRPNIAAIYVTYFVAVSTSTAGQRSSGTSCAWRSE